MTVSHRSMEHQADRIETVLASHKISARVWGGVVLPRFCRYQLTFASGTRVDSVTRLAEEMALSLGVPAVRVWRENAAIQVEVPRPGAGRTVPLDDLLANVPADRLARRGLVAALGLDENGMPLLIRIDSPDVAHVLIVGTTGSGKTVLARTILASLVEIHEPADLSLLLIDPKGGRGYNPFAGLPHLVGPIATDPDAGEQALAWLVQTMEQRDAEQRSTPHIVCAIDELADLLITGGKPLQTAVVRLAQRGREAGIHLVACTQRPAAEVMSGLLKANFPVRLVGAVTSPEDAKVATGIAGSGAEKLLGRGDFLLVSRGRVRRFQAAVARTDT
jgi:S-DNA-T family DNA segregation ATPase FtsK/SpoIIIE